MLGSDGLGRWHVRRTALAVPLNHELAVKAVAVPFHDEIHIGRIVWS